MTVATDAAARAGLAAGLASGSRTLDAWSRLFTGLSLLGCILPPPAEPGWKPLLLLVLLAGLGQLYFALRIAIDRPVFSLWARRWRESESGVEHDLAAFDTALHDLGLGHSGGPTRALPDRLRGLRRLLVRQVALLAVQTLGLAAACGLVLAN